MKKRIVLTGGPSGGKTTALSIIKETFGNKVELSKEAATMIYAGGFPRNTESSVHIYHAQRIIYFASIELENLADTTAPQDARLVICDRGTVDGCVYWPHGIEQFFKDMQTTKEQEFKRYDYVIHLSPPPKSELYYSNAVRTESFEEAIELDKRIMEAWAGHPNRIIIEGKATYLEKAEQIRAVINQLLGESK